MAHFRFIGDPKANGHGPASVTIRGYTFGRESWTEVPDDVSDSLDTHSHLERRVEDSISDDPGEQPKRRGRPPKVKANV